MKAHLTHFINNDGRVAALMSWFRNMRRKEASIPRLAIDADFRTISSGIILLTEMTKVLVKSQTIQFLDLYGNTTP